MRYWCGASMASLFLLFTTACVPYSKERFAWHDHLYDYKTKAYSIPKMPPSKLFRYDDQYDIPDIEPGGSLDVDVLVAPPGSKG